MKKIHLAEV